MTWFRVGGAGIPAALKNSMNAVFNKKFGTSGQNYPPNSWPDDVNLMGPLPEGTASGSIANISDGADQVPVKSWNSNVDASVGGVSEVNGVQTGRNISSVNEYPNNPWTFWGTNFVDMRSALNTLPAGTYTLSYTFEILEAPDTGNITYGKPFIRALVNGNYVNLTSYSISDASGVSAGDKFAVSASFTINAETMGKIESVYIYCDKKESHSGGAGRGSYNLVNAMLEIGSTAHAYESYSPTQYTVSLGRTIHGGSLELISGAGTDENGVNFTFDPISPIPETENVCNFWTNVGSSSIVYRRDIDLALQAVSSSRGLMMASRPVTQLVGEESDPDQVNELVENDETEQEGEDDAR